MKEEDALRVIAALKTMKGWSITANEEAEFTKEDEAIYDGLYKADCKVKNGALHVTVCGRVDSITSNDLLAKYNEAKGAGGYETIEMDCSNLTYISSAGLRVLLIMKKDLPMLFW